MKQNRKGFTLIELLAVVVILLAISVIAISSISAAIERNKKKQLDTKISLIISNVDVYYQTHRNSFTTSCISISELISQGIITTDEGSDADGNIIQGNILRNNNTFEYTSDVCP